MPLPPSSSPVAKNAAAAPVVFFDNAPTYGLFAGIVQVELTACILTSKDGKSVQVDHTTTAHLRCSIEAARNLVSALNGALGIVDPPVKLAS